MGGTISKRKDFFRKRPKEKKRRGVQETSVDEHHDSEEAGISAESVEHIYMNIDENTADIDSVDGTYYQEIEQNRPILHRHGNSIDTTTSNDSAFSENSTNSKQTIVSNSSDQRETQNNDSFCYARAGSIFRRSSSADKSWRSDSFRRDCSGYIISPARNAQKDTPYGSYADCRCNGSSARGKYMFSSRLEGSDRSDRNGYILNSVPDAKLGRAVYKRSRKVSQSTDIDVYGYSVFPKSNRKSRHKHHVEKNESGIDNCTDDWKDVCKAPMDRVVFLLEAFEPLIAGCLNVMELVPHLVFIDNTEWFRERHRQSPRDAVVQLIQTIKDSDEPGKWQAFLEALRAEGYDYIAKLLLEKTEEDHAINRKILRLFTPELITRIDPEEFIDHLLEEDLIGETDREEIQCEKRNKGDIAASLLLLERVPRRLENWPDLFIKVLEKCGLQDLVENFRVPEISRDQKGTNGGNYYITPCQSEESSLKMHEFSNAYGQKIISNEFETDDFEYDIEMKRLLHQRNMLERKVKNQRKMRKLRSDIDSLTAELEATDGGDNMETVMMNTAIKYDPCEKETEPELVEYKTTRNGNAEVATESIKTDDSKRDGCKDSTDNHIPETPKHLLSKIALGVQSIHEILKEIRDDSKGNAMKNEKPLQNDSQSGNGYVTRPPLHTFNRSKGYVPSREQYLGMRSYDSAISMGYITSNVEQYV